MKPCPYCAETMQDQAVVCPHCARPFLEGVVSVHQMGRVYAIGRRAGGFALWNMVTGGGPVGEYNQDEWQKAWKRFVAEEQALGSSGGGGGVFLGVSVPIGE